MLAPSDCRLPDPILVLGFVIWMSGGPACCPADPPPAVEPVNPNPSLAESTEVLQRPQRPDTARGIYKVQITPHWFRNNTRFWYRNDLPGGALEFIVVDAVRGQRTPAFDHVKLAAALAKVSATEQKAEHLPFSEIDFVEDGNAVRFTMGATTWKCNLMTYECLETEPGPRLPPTAEPKGTDRQSTRPRPRNPERSNRSPDGRWAAIVKDHNLFIRAQEGETEIQLSRDGQEGFAYASPSWSPDSKTLAAFRVEPGDRKEVHLIESSPAGGGRAKVISRPYPLPGDKFSAYELSLFDVASQKQIKPDVDRIDFDFPNLRWNKNGRHFTYQKIDRGHQRFRVIDIDADTGQARTIIDERTQTFIWTAHTENVSLNLVNELDKSGELIYASERDGWRHLYLIDATDGRVKNRITQGDWVVRGIDRIDEDSRQIWFRASGMNAEQDPYFIHFCRVNFDGTGLIALTSGNGTHTVQYSPDRKYLIDNYSRVDQAPVHELRRVEDGKLVCELDKADITELIAIGWAPPEVFVAKARDGKTDTWGIICRPKDFDPNKKYPVIEQIYAGPQGSFVPKSFSATRRFASLTDMGFIVVQSDGMGTANRSKAFHDVCWHNLKDAGLPDRILWHQAVAKKYPYYDLTRVGIYGVSAGGQSATGAVLFYPDFYKVAVSACGCHDNRMDKASWNEQWMGYPVGPHYAECSNIDHAHRLRGKLLLIVGEMDSNVPPESTLRLADALIKAGKDFDLVVVPGVNHGMGGAYGTRRMHDFFAQHLLGIEPPNRNGAVRGNEN
jgi:dipeptidyl aminopeptidase/acylaminoacyl peptidase